MPTTIPSIVPEEASFWDRHFEVRSIEINQFITNFNAGNIQNTSDIPTSILDWPARNNPYIDKTSGASYTIDFDRDLAPFVDVSF